VECDFFSFSDVSVLSKKLCGGMGGSKLNGIEIMQEEIKMINGARIHHGLGVRILFSFYENF